MRRVLILMLGALILNVSFSVGPSVMPVAAQEPCPVEDGVVVNPDAAGTAATGQCAPPRADRLIDSAIWIFTLGVLVAVVVLVVRSGRRPAEEPDAGR